LRGFPFNKLQHTKRILGEYGGKMRPVETIPGMGGRGIKKNDGGHE
jgi:hypothetical protein